MREITLSKGYVALVDDEDYERVNQTPWCAFVTPWTVYGIHTFREPGKKQKTVRLHRFILGIDDPAVHIDHRDRNGLNNCRSNLRACTPTQNSCNRARWTGKSSYRGVHKHREGKWEAGIRVDGKRIYLGLFESDVAAALAFDKAARELRGEFAVCNFPQSKPAEVVYSLSVDHNSSSYAS
jgi:hypothetical protein